MSLAMLQCSVNGSKRECRLTPSLWEFGISSVEGWELTGQDAVTRVHAARALNSLEGEGFKVVQMSESSEDGSQRHTFLLRGPCMADSEHPAYKAVLEKHMQPPSGSPRRRPSAPAPPREDSD
ncbi:unnamed protein product [Symbiodinium sp. CCMP2592]|nr:unnamed protein product [Symbiodinium sp. CCMP2592]